MAIYLRAMYAARLVLLYVLSAGRMSERAVKCEVKKSRHLFKTQTQSIALFTVSNMKGKGKGDNIHDAVD